MSFLDWWRDGREDRKKLAEARQERVADKLELNRKLAELYNGQSELQRLMSAMLEKRGGHDA